MKGILTVKFIDEKTKKVVKEVTKENLVTDAYKNIFSSFINYWSQVKGNAVNNSTNSANYFFTFGEQFAKLFFGGLLVFNDNIADVNAQHILLEDSDVAKYIGCANSKTSSVGTMKGTFNSVLSEFTDSYAKFVWDFTAAQLYNQDIGAFALTSDLGGQFGLGNDDQDASQKGRFAVACGIDATQWLLTSSGGTSPVLGYEGLSKLSAGDTSFAEENMYIDKENNKIYISAFSSYGKKLRVRELDLTKFNIELNYKANYGAVDATKETEYSLGRSTRYAVELFKNITNSPYVYRAHREWNSNSGDGTIWRYDIRDGSETSYNPLHADFISAVANFNSTGNTKGCVIEEGGTPYFLCWAPNSARDTVRVWKYNISAQTFTYADTVLSTVQATQFGGTTGNIRPILGIMEKPYIAGYAAVNNSNCYNLFRIKSDLTLSKTAELQINNDNRFVKVIESPLLKLPMAVSQSNGANFHTPLCLTTYFATICNLDAVLTKVDSAMQVTYTLYNN